MAVLLPLRISASGVEYPFARIPTHEAQRLDMFGCICIGLLQGRLTLGLVLILLPIYSSEEGGRGNGSVKNK